jgi:D-alanine-D-alanine ligase
MASHLPDGFRDVILVADSQHSTNSTIPTHRRRDLEKSEDSTVAALLSAFRELGITVHHYKEPSELGANAKHHREDLVFSIYGGEKSRNRMALVPAICEAHGLRYVGPDVYTTIICQDKEISKNLAHESGLTTPRHRIVRTKEDFGSIRSFSPPFVVKPLLEGSSIGISQKNLIFKEQDGIAFAEDLLITFEQPIMIEEFIGGREVSYNSIESQPVNLWSYSEIHVAGQEDYFDSHLFDADEKLHRHLPRTVRTIDSELSETDKTHIDRFLAAVGKYGYCRVDGKHYKGKFVFLEVTPDAWIAPGGAFAASFINKGWSYADVISKVLASAV